MSIKSIVVLVSDDAVSFHALDTAIALARQFGAHLRVGHVVPPAHMPAGAIGRAASMEYVSEAEETAKAKAEALQAKVAAVCAPQLSSWQWRCEHGEALEATSRLAALADLVVSVQWVETLLEDIVTTNFIEHLLMAADCPLLMLPHNWQGGPVGGKVLVAWKATREAQRSVRSALPFLTQAQKTYILAASAGREATPPGSDLASYFAHHGISAEMTGTSADGCEDILAAAKQHGCDLIVMGAFHRGSVSELVFGGSTAFMLRNSTLPVLLRH